MVDNTYTYVTSTGLIIPNTSATLAQVQGEWQTAFGSDLITTPDTPQGVMITAEALARNNVINNNALLANQINPNYAGGVFLDAIMALTGQQRIPQTYTTVTAVTVTGVAGTVIPAGSIATTAVGDQFQTTAAVTLPSGGSTTVNFVAVNGGPVPCGVGALTIIYSAVLGWETVTNSNAGILGILSQSDASARAYRNNTLAYNGISLAAAITSALYAVQGVNSLTFQENYTSSIATINGITMVPNSIYTCVSGGTNIAIAAAILENKPSGCAMNGGTTVSVVEPASGQTYQVLFDVPTQVGVLVNATVHGATSPNVTSAILAYAAGSIPSYAGFTVGSYVQPFEIAAAIAALNSGAIVSSVTVSYSSGTPSFSANPLAINFNQQAYTQASYITVTIV